MDNAIESSLQPIKLLRGAPISVLWLLVVTRASGLEDDRPVSVQWLARHTGYTEKPVTQAMGLLADYGLVDRAGRCAWRLTEKGFRLLRPETENFRIVGEENAPGHEPENFRIEREETAPRQEPDTENFRIVGEENACRQERETENFRIPGEEPAPGQDPETENFRIVSEENAPTQERETEKFPLPREDAGGEPPDPENFRIAREDAVSDTENFRIEREESAPRQERETENFRVPDVDLASQDDSSWKNSVSEPVFASNGAANRKNSVSRERIDASSNTRNTSSSSSLNLNLLDSRKENLLPTTRLDEPAKSARTDFDASAAPPVTSHQREMAAELARHGIREPKRSELAVLEHMTLDLIRYHCKTSESTGQAVYRMLHNWAVPAPVESAPPEPDQPLEDPADESADGDPPDPPLNAGQLWAWDRALSLLRAEIPAVEYHTWVSCARLARVAAGEWTVVTANHLGVERFAEKGWGARLAALISEAAREPVRVRVAVGNVW